MGWLDLLTPVSWKRAEAGRVAWDRGWPISSPRRVLKEFWIADPIAIRPTKTPLGYTARRVTPCVDVMFHFDGGRIVIDKATVHQGLPLNCSCVQGEGFKVVPNFFDRGVVEALLQKEADTKKSNLRARVYSVMVEEREAAGLDIPGRRRSKYRDEASMP